MGQNRSGKDGGFIVCRDRRLEATGKFRDCEFLDQPGTNIAVRMIEREGLPGYVAEVVITAPVGEYKGPSTPCELPAQFNRFLPESERS